MKVIIILLLALCLFSCDLTIMPDFWTIDVDEQTGIELKKMSIKEIRYFVYENKIPHEKEKGDYWKTPQETWNDKKGDCEDKASLFLALVYKYKNIKGQMVRQIKGNEGHLYTVINNKPYDKLDYNDQFTKYEFDEIPYIASGRR